MKKINWTKVRGYAYRVILGVGVVAVFYGWLSADEAVLWGGLLATVLMVTPTANTPVAGGRHVADDSGEPTTEPGDRRGAGGSIELPADGLPTTIPPLG